MGTTNFVFAVGRTKKYSMRNEHSDHIVRENTLLDPVVLPPKPPPKDHYFELEVTAQRVLVPPVVTTYWCQVMKMDVRLQSRKHHAIRYEAIITPGNEHLVHHMEIFHCRSHPGESYGGPCDEKPLTAQSCSQVLAAWAMGADAVVYPPEAGMPLGGDDFIPYLMIEIHYNNVHRESGAHDSSGFRIGYTDQLRPFDAGIMELGHCVSECTRHFPSSGIKIFATQLHAHLTGRKLFTSHFRKGVKIGEINRDNHYSPHWQVVRSLPVHAHVLPGDVLSTTCQYDTSERSNWTWGGYEIESEMCVNYIHFYPAANVEVCKSAISNQTLDRFFRKHLGKNQQKHLIHERYLNLPQNQRTYDEIHEWYATESLNMACLDHSGQLIEDSTVNWNHVQRPETFGGVFDRNGARAECPAIND
ncbi:hypothetical protein M3Y96_00231800 [Aphelenchoides besseyi]|nr:hypothetical protein M3Y96_00231800 [Aphelenchoides besseyi]